MTEKALTTQTGLMPMLSINEAVARYNAIVEFTQTVMKEGKDYGSPFPGTNKPTLLKPGAEKLASLFGLYPDFVILDKIVDFDKGMFYFQYQCDLYRDGVKVGSGNGSCNSQETKYKYRWINTSEKPSKEEAEEIKATGLGRWRKQNNKWVWQKRIENSEPFELVNTIDKMAQKRALVAATLIAANASEFFTQDIEDMNIIEAEYVEEEKPIPAKQEQPKNENGEKGTSGKSWSAELVQAFMSKDNGIVEDENSFNAVGVLNALDRAGAELDDIDKAVALGQRYRAERNNGIEDVDEAARLAVGGE